MARKVFISVLGTGLYESGIYTKGEFKSTETRFIQQATIELLGCKETWTEDDKICILLTEQARKLNWDVTVRKARCTGEEIPYEGLKNILEKMDLKPTLLDVPISDGKDEKEMWDIFQTVFNLLQEDDELYFDLTHSFRYLPMLILVLGNYAKFLKNVQIAHISYGNYEARNENGSPIVNLLPLTALQDWTFAAANFIHNGQSEELVQLTKDAITPILAATLGKDEGANSLKKLFTTLETIISNMQTCRGLSITQEADVFKLKQSIESSSADIIPPLVPVIKKIEKSFSNFSADANTINGLHAAQWCYKNRMYQQAITILQETIVTIICKQVNLSIKDEKERGLVNSAFYIVSNKKQHDEDSWSLDYGSRDEAVKIVRELIQLPIVNELSQVFSDATKLRNDFNHAGFRPNPSRINKIRNNIGKCINEVFNLLIPHNPINKLAPSTPIFINFSNHSLSTWTERQIKAAKEYGELEEIVFPNINPQFTTEQVQMLATDYVAKILTHYSTENLTIHVMGELTFCFSVVQQLKEKGVRCVASTTERIVEETADNKKVTQFSFVQFREY